MSPDSKSQRRRFAITTNRFVIGLLCVEALLWLSEWFHVFAKGWAVLTAIACVGVALLLMLLWFAASLINRRRFQFSVRSLFVLVLAIAIPCGWLAIARKRAQRQSEIVEEIITLGGFVHYDWQVVTDVNSFSIRQAPGAEWLRRLLGDDFFAEIGGVYFIRTPVTADELERLNRLTKVRQLWLEDKSVTDDGLICLEYLPQLQKLHLDSSQITDEALEHVRGLAQLQELGLNGTHISDVGLDHLKGLTQLQVLVLSDTQVTDFGLMHLRSLTHLQYLYLDHVPVTDAGLKYIKGLSHLQLLMLSNTGVTDVGLEDLNGLAQLDTLYLHNTHVTDAGLEHLYGLSQLKVLHLEGTMVTKAGVKKLASALPHCQIQSGH